jgi:ParB/RepB/Spo0J family partition protein
MAKAKKVKKVEETAGETKRAPCAHVGADGYCTNQTGCEGVFCSGCEDYQDRGELTPPKAGELRVIPVEMIYTSRHQVRMVEGTEELDAGIEELAASIRASGLAQPLTVRPSTPWELAPGRGSDGWELIAGHRRLAACKQAGLTEVPCYVLTVSDAAAADLTLIENLQRKDLTAIEEADSVAAMLKLGRTKEQIADACGKSVRWVYRRASVGNLTPEWRAAALKLKLSAAFCEAVAKYPAEVQGYIYTEMRVSACEPDDLDYYGEALKAGGEVERADMVARRILGRLSERPWAAGRKGWCEGCAKRSDQQDDLFDPEAEDDDEETGARCLDPECWAKKVDQWVEEQRAELKQKAGNLVEADERSYWHFRNQGTKVKTKANTVPVLVTEGTNKGDVYWVPARSEDGDGAQGVSARPKGPTQKQKEMAAYCRAVETIVRGAEDRPEFDHDGETVFISLDTLIALVVALGASQHSYAPKGIEAWCGAKRTKAVCAKMESATDDDKRDILWRMVRPGVWGQMKFDTVSCCEAAHANCEELVRVLGIPDGMIRAALAAGGKGRGRAGGVEADPEEED